MEMQDLVAKYLSGNASGEEIEKLESWRNESEENAREFLDYKEIWTLSGAVDVQAPELDARIGSILEEKEGKTVMWPSFLKYAAAIALLAMISILWFVQGNKVEAPEVFSGSSTVLDDGTIVSLKDGAKVISASISEESRSVQVEGKAFFEVHHDEERPFYVVTDNANITVLGTSFMVESTDEFTEVCVESGIVRFSTASSRSMSLDLEKGEMGTIGKNIQGIIKRTNRNQNFLAWKDGLMTFERTKMKDVATTLEDTYGIDIEFSPRLGNCRLSATYEQISLEEVIKYLSATFSWQYQITEDKVVLSGEGC